MSSQRTHYTLSLFIYFPYDQRMKKQVHNWMTRLPYALSNTFKHQSPHFGLTVERGIVPPQEYREPACLLTQSNEAGTNDYPL